jgi:hypothetical protein
MIAQSSGYKKCAPNFGAHLKVANPRKPFLKKVFAELMPIFPKKEKR